MKPNVLVTGGSGRVGRRLLAKLLERGYSVKVLYHRSKPALPSGSEVELVRGDIVDQTQMARAVEGSEVICHLAASYDMFPPARFEKDNDALFENIIRGTYNLLEAARRSNRCQAFIHASTDAVYATGPIRYDSPITEETPISPSPGRFYALAKAVTESLCMSYGKTFGLPWIVIRINWALEEREALRVFTYEFWQDVMSANDRARIGPRIAGGKGVFCPEFPGGERAVEQIAHPEDTAEGIALAVDHRLKAGNNVFNIAAPSPFGYREISQQIASRLGLPLENAVVEGFEPYSISNAKAESLLGYHPVVTMERMVARALDEGDWPPPF